MGKRLEYSTRKQTARIEVKQRDHLKGHHAHSAKITTTKSTIVPNSQIRILKSEGNLFKKEDFAMAVCVQDIVQKTVVVDIHATAANADTPPVYMTAIM